MKYSTIKLLELINAAVIIIVFGIAMTLRFPAQSTSWMITLIVILIILVIPLFILEHKGNRKYPQWDRLWRMPTAAIVVFTNCIKLVVLFHTLQIGAKCSGLFVFKGSQQCQGFRRFVKSAGGCIQMHLGAFKTIASLIEKGLQGAIVC